MNMLNTWHARTLLSEQLKSPRYTTLYDLVITPSGSNKVIAEVIEWLPHRMSEQKLKKFREVDKMGTGWGIL